MPRNRSQTLKRPQPRGEPVVIENSGLCATCENRPTCMYAGDAEKPVIECEEFTHGPVGPGGSPRPRLNLAAPPGQRSPDEAFPPVKGLCEDCESRFTCTFARLDGGVWQCGEYR